MKKVCPIIAVYDNLLDYKNISVEQNEAVAKRGFTNSLKYVLESGEYNDVNPTDLSLYCLGTVDLVSGDIEPCNPRAIVHGTSIVTEWQVSKCNCEDNKKVEEV